MAAPKAVEWCQTQQITRIKIHHDDQGLARWSTRGWKANTPFTQKYAETVHASGLSIEWVKVKAHSGDIVDEEAKQAAKCL